MLWRELFILLGIIFCSYHMSSIFSVGNCTKVAITSRSSNGHFECLIVHDGFPNPIHDNRGFRARCFALRIQITFIALDKTHFDQNGQ